MNSFEILYDNRSDYQPSNYPFRIVRYVLNGVSKEIRFYKKQKEYNYDDIMLEKYIISLNKRAYKRVTNIVSKFIGNERIVNYTINKQVFELHFDRDDKEFFIENDELKKYIMSVI